MMSVRHDDPREGIRAGGECLAPATAEAIERAFECALVNEYGASEHMSIAFGCRQGVARISDGLQEHGSRQ